MKKDNRTNILFRYVIIIAAILVFSSRIVYKMFDTTVVHSEEWNQKAMTELSSQVIIQPERGNILAADGSVLAANLRYYTVRIDYRAEKFMENKFRAAADSLADSLAVMFPKKNRDEWKAHLLKPLEKPKKKRPRAYAIISNISYADLMHLRRLPFFKIKNPNRTGLTVEDYLRRVNPYGNMARRSIGGVGASKECSEIHGISGLEKALDSLLYGVPGIAKKIPLTRDFVNWTDKPAVAGYNIKTTIDINTQDIVENELNQTLEYVNADWGVAVLMKVSTGDICAISNLEKSASGIGYIEGMNRAVLGFEPGSVVKTISMLIALEDGIVTNPNEVIVTGPAWAYAGGRPITDAHGVNSLTVKEVIERSSNIGMAKIITRRYDSNPSGYYSRLKELGLLEPMNTGIAGERPPRIDSVPNDRGGRIALSRMSYGYTTEIPPLYTLSIYNAIANGGRYVRPRLVSELISENGIDSVLPVTYIRDRICSEKNAELLREMLTSVVWGDHGTGRRLKNPLVKLAGKTGTCYMIENGAYNTGKKRLAFCGFFPADNPQYSCIVLIANPRQNAFGAASTSGEVMKNIALKLYSRGMLNNSSDYIADSKEGPHGASPLYYTSIEAQDAPRKLHEVLGIGGKHRRYKSPAAKIAQGCIPDVKGLGAREAVKHLEKAGYNVALNGTGCVLASSPAAGTKASAGTRVTLTLGY